LGRKGKQYHLVILADHPDPLIDPEPIQNLSMPVVIPKKKQPLEPNETFSADASFI